MWQAWYHAYLHARLQHHLWLPAGQNPAVPDVRAAAFAAAGRGLLLLKLHRLLLPLQVLQCRATCYNNRHDKRINVLLLGTDLDV